MITLYFINFSDIANMVITLYNKYRNKKNRIKKAVPFVAWKTQKGTAAPKTKTVFRPFYYSKGRKGFQDEINEKGPL